MSSMDFSIESWTAGARRVDSIAAQTQSNLAALCAALQAGGGTTPSDAVVAAEVARVQQEATLVAEKVTASMQGQSAKMGQTAAILAQGEQTATSIVGSML